MTYSLYKQGSLTLNSEKQVYGIWELHSKLPQCWINTINVDLLFTLLLQHLQCSFRSFYINILILISQNVICWKWQSELQGLVANLWRKLVYTLVCTFELIWNILGEHEASQMTAGEIFLLEACWSFIVSLGRLKGNRRMVNSFFFPARRWIYTLKEEVRPPYLKYIWCPPLLNAKEKSQQTEDTS